MTERVEVCARSALEDGAQTVEVRGRTFAVVSHEGEVYAIQNRCPHQGGQLCEGLVRSALTATWEEPGDRTKEAFDGPPAVSCPYHGWEFDLESGDHLGDDTVSVATLETVTEDGTVYVKH